jgi:hypothetical protein
MLTSGDLLSACFIEGEMDVAATRLALEAALDARLSVFGLVED